MADALHEVNTVGLDVAATHMVTLIPRVQADATVESVLELLRGQVYRCAGTIFVIDPADRFLGIVRINDLFSDGGHLIREIMEPEHEAVGLSDDQ